MRTQTRQNTAFQSAEAVREFFAARQAELEAEALAHPQYAGGEVQAP